MDKQTYNIKFDTTITHTVNSGVTLKQGDANMRLILLVEINGVPYFDESDVPSIVFRRPNGTSIVDGTVGTTSTQYYYDILGDELNYAGKLMVDLKFNSATARESTYTAIINVETDTIRNDQQAADIYTCNYQTILDKVDTALNGLGYGYFNINDDGHLILTKTESLDNVLTFAIVDNERLEVTIK